MDKLKIIYAGNTHIPFSGENLIIRQLIREGHKVIPFVYPNITDIPFDIYNKKLLKTIEENNFDLLIGAKVRGLKKESIKKIKIPKISWVFDLFKGYIKTVRSEWYEPQAKGWDACFGAEAGQVDYYKSLGINYFPLKEGADPEWNRKVKPDEDYKELGCDVSFLGGIYNALRINMQSAILSIPNITYKNYVGYKMSDVSRIGIYFEVVSHLANFNPITIGCNYRNDIEGYWGDRPYKMMGSNHFMIQTFVKGMEKEGFKHKKNTVFFYDDNFDEMTELIEYYLREENQGERDKIRESGYQLIHKNHMVNNRTEILFKTLKKRGII